MPAPGRDSATVGRGFLPKLYLVCPVRQPTAHTGSQRCRAVQRPTAHCSLAHASAVSDPLLVAAELESVLYSTAAAVFPASRPRDASSCCRLLRLHPFYRFYRFTKPEPRQGRSRRAFCAMRGRPALFTVFRGSYDLRITTDASAGWPTPPRARFASFSLFAPSRLPLSVFSSELLA